MRDLVEQIRRASDCGLYYMALMGALVIPDLCGALASDDGSASKTKYCSWLRDNVPEQCTEAELIYGLRCSLLHQGRAHPHGAHHPIACVEPVPGAPQIHNLSTEVAGDRVGWLSIPMFVDEICRGALGWPDAYETSATVQRNLAKFVRRCPEGLLPHVAGCPVIA